MTNPLTQARNDVTDLLNAAGLNAYAYMPDRVSPPLVAVQGGTPYVETGNTFTSNLVRFTVRVVLAPGDAGLRAEELDDMVFAVSDALVDTGWTVTVNEPGSITVGTAEYPAVDISVEQYLDL